MNEKKSIIFTVFCIIIVCCFGYRMLQSEAHDFHLQDGVSIYRPTKTTQTGEKRTPQNSGGDLLIKSGGYQRPIANPKKDDPIKIQPARGELTGIVTKTYIKDWKLAYTKVEAVVNSGSISRHILRSCIHTRNQPHCVNSILGVTKAESSIFRNCSKNNCFGLMKPKGGLMQFETVKYGIDAFVERYNKYRYANDNAQEWIQKSHYCASADCIQKGSNRWISYDSFIGYIK